MSIIRAALRLCAVQALRESTWAQNRVMNSHNQPLLEMLEIEKPKDGVPFIVVFTDDDAFEPNSIEHGIYSASRALQLVLEIGVASGVVGTKGSTRVQLEHTDASMEMTLDAVQAQALAAIHGDPRNEWGELCRDMIMRILRVTSMRAGGSKGVKWAARQVVITLDTLADPIPGAGNYAADHPVRRFIELAKVQQPAGTYQGAQLLEMILTQYPFDTTRASWEQAQAMLGITRRALRGIGIAPLAEVPEGATPYATETGVSIVNPDTQEAPTLTRIIADNEDEPGVENTVADTPAEDEEPKPPSWPPWLP